MLFPRHPSLHSALSCLALFTGAPVAYTAAINKHQTSITNAEYGSSTSVHESILLPAHDADLNRRDPAAVTTTYTVDQTTIIIIDPSPSTEASSVEGIQTDSLGPQSNGATEIGEGVGTSTVGSSSPEVEASTSSTELLDPGPTAAGALSGTTTELTTTSAPQSSGTPDSSPFPTSTAPDSTQDHDTVTTIEVPQGSTSTPPGSRTNTGTTIAVDEDEDESSSSSETQEPVTNGPPPIATSPIRVPVDTTETDSPSESTPIIPKPDPDAPTNTLSGPVFTPGPISSGTQTLPDVETIPGMIGGTIFSPEAEQSPLPTETSPTSSSDGLGLIQTTSGIGGQPSPATSITTVFVTTILESGTPAETLITCHIYVSVIQGILPIIESWEDDPTGIRGDTLNSLDELDTEIDGFIIGLGGGLNTGGGGGGGGSSHGCGAKKRKRGIFDFATDIIQTAIDAFICIDDVVGDLASNIEANLPGPIPGLKDDLTNLLNGLAVGSNNNDEPDPPSNDDDNNEDDDDDDDDDDDQDKEEDEDSTTLSPVTSTFNSDESTSTQTTSETFELQQSTTVTVTGCSVTPTTTTITKDATCRPKTTSTCIATTAPQVTVACRPRYQTQDGTITTTTTCSPSTTHTVTGCSVTPTTTTVTKEPTCRPKTPTTTISYGARNHHDLDSLFSIGDENSHWLLGHSNDDNYYQGSYVPPTNYDGCTNNPIDYNETSYIHYIIDNHD
ncbi:hypothetical protein BJX65DRAFT_310413 [Aspergillus insuetus]